MAHVRYTKNLLRFFPDLQEGEIGGQTVADILAQVEQQHPGFRRYIVDDQGALRKHVNIFVQGQVVKDREGLSDPVGPTAEIFFVQALSGG